MTTSWYVPNICLEGGIYVVAKRLRAPWELTKWPPFFFKLKSSLKDPLFFYSPHQMTPYFSFVLTERPHIYSVTERPLLLGSCPHIPVTSICDCPPPPEHWCGVIHVHTNLENDIFLELNSITFYFSGLRLRNPMDLE